MNKKTLAVAALALIATSGLASAQNVRQQPRFDREAPIVRPYNSNAAIYLQGEDRLGPSWTGDGRSYTDRGSYDENAYGSKPGANTD